MRQTTVRQDSIDSTIESFLDAFFGFISRNFVKLGLIGVAVVLFWTYAMPSSRAWLPMVGSGLGMLLQLARGADEGRDVVTDHLRDDRAARRILRDGGEDLRIEPRIGQDPEVFGEINVRVSVAANQAHEAQIRNILHRREREERLVAAE